MRAESVLDGPVGSAGGRTPAGGLVEVDRLVGAGRPLVELRTPGRCSLVHMDLRLRHWPLCTLAGVPPVAVPLRPAVPAEAEALSRLALRSKGHWR